MKSLQTAKKPQKSAITPGVKNEGHDVEFTFYAPEAKKVYLAGKFNEWNRTSLPMKKDKDGMWRTKLSMSAGNYEYKYIVDGDWAQELSCPALALNTFGTYNCVIGVH
jgi:1,4-alpha-glucan branching enzyme